MPLGGEPLANWDYTSMPRTKPKRATPPRAIAREIVEAAVACAGDDPLRWCTVDTATARLIYSDDEIDAGIAEAVKLGWLKSSGGPHPHSIAVGGQWRFARGYS